MTPLKTSALALAAFLAAALLPGCAAKMGVESEQGFLYDHTYGTLYASPDYLKDANPDKIKQFRKFQTSKVMIPVPFTFGALSFGWGDISTEKIMEEGNFKKLALAEYRRLNICFVYQNYEITAYGN